MKDSDRIKKLRDHGLKYILLVGTDSEDYKIPLRDPSGYTTLPLAVRERRDQVFHDIRHESVILNEPIRPAHEDIEGLSLWSTLYGFLLHGQGSPEEVIPLQESGGDLFLGVCEGAILEVTQWMTDSQKKRYLKAVL